MVAFALAAVVLATAPVKYEPNNVMIEDCVSVGEHGVPHCFLEKITHGELQLLMTRESYDALEPTYMKTIFETNITRFISEDVYFKRRVHVFGAYLFEDSPYGMLQASATGFPDGFQALVPTGKTVEDLRASFFHGAPDPLAGDPRLKDATTRCAAGVVGNAINGGLSLGLGAAGVAAALSAPAVVVVGAFVSFGAVGAVANACMAYSAGCKDVEDEAAAAAANAAPDPAVAQKKKEEGETAPPPPPPPPSPDPTCDPTTTSCSTPLPDAAPQTGIVLPLREEGKAHEPPNTTLIDDIYQSARTADERLTPDALQTRTKNLILVPDSAPNDSSAGQPTAAPPSPDIPTFNTLINPRDLGVLPLRRFPGLRIHG